MAWAETDSANQARLMIAELDAAGNVTLAAMAIGGLTGRIEEGPIIAVAGNESGTTLMCLHHAAAWSESNLCRDVAQHNSGASRLALSTWLNSVQAPRLVADGTP